MKTDALEIVAGSKSAPLMLTCEHASLRLPEPWRWPEADLPLVGTHWSFDLGAEDLTREMAAASGATAILSRFTRLLVDPNRPLDSPTLFRDVADGNPVALNQHIDDDDRGHRIAYYDAYHRALADLATQAPPLLLSIHTFTPVYEGQRRQVDLGILFDSAEEEARQVLEALLDTGLQVELNQPWSGRNGLMYSVESHATRNSRRALEIELRQDHATDPEFRQWFVPRLLEAMTRLVVP